jgi:hypothetical protein
MESTQSVIPNDDEEEAEESFKDSIKGTFKMLISKEMRLFLAQCFWTGVSESYWQGLVGPIISRSLPNATVEG